MPRKKISKSCKRCGIAGEWGVGGRYCFDCRVKCDDPDPHPVYKCRACKAAKAAKYRDENPEYIEEARKRRRMTFYGLTREALTELELISGCESCGDAVSLVIDHDHETGRVRGMLCNPCNTALGFLREDVKRMLSLIDYTECKTYR